MTETDALGLDHPIDHRPRRATAKAVKEVRVGTDYQAGGFLLMEWTTDRVVLALLHRLVALALHQSQQ